MEQQPTATLIYSPTAVLNLYNNSLNPAQSKRLIQLKGIFQPGKGGNYSGYFYDSLRDESSDAQLTIIVPALIRSEMQPAKTVTVNGFITKRVVNNSSRIDIQLTVTDLVDQTINKYSDEELMRIELQQLKATAGFRDVNGFIKEKMISGEPFRISVIIGRTGIIDNDIKHQLRESVSYYDIQFHRINLSSETEIIRAIRDLDKSGSDIIVISRGGGENLDIFNKLIIAREAIDLSSFFVTAIGHKDDVTLLQKVADKAFITPSEFGQFLNDIYNQTFEEVQHSKARLIESVTKQLSAGFQQQIENLQVQLKNVETLKNQNASDLQKIYEEKIESFAVIQKEKQASSDEQLNNYRLQIELLESRPRFGWLALIIAIMSGLIIGVLLMKH